MGKTNSDEKDEKDEKKINYVFCPASGWRKGQAVHTQVCFQRCPEKNTKKCVVMKSLKKTEDK